tara:strand:- start:244 stop:777 length:534 start_codon:yes stop_codon:yes gene_type:complete
MEKININGLKIIKGFSFKDNRGELMKPFSVTFGNSEDLKIKEVWFTMSSLNVVRAMHMQVGPMATQKFVTPISGAILDVIVDCRSSSSTFRNVFMKKINAIDNIALKIPKGCAHGYRVLSKNTVVMYMADNIHDEKNDVGFKWNSFGFDWGIINPIISDRDTNLPEIDSLDFEKITD